MRGVGRGGGGLCCPDPEGLQGRRLDLGFHLRKGRLPLEGTRAPSVRRTAPLPGAWGHGGGGGGGALRAWEGRRRGLAGLVRDRAPESGRRAGPGPSGTPPR